MGHFFAHQIFFRVLGLVLYSKQTTRNLTQPNSPQHPINSSIRAILVIVGSFFPSGKFDDTYVFLGHTGTSGGQRQVSTVAGSQDRKRWGCTQCHAWPWSYDHRPSHPYNAGTEPVGFSPTRLTMLAPSAKGREVFGESQRG